MCHLELTETIKALAELAWPALFVLVVFLFRARVLEILGVFREQMAAGATLKFGDLELKGIEVGSFQSNPNSIFERAEQDVSLTSARNALMGGSGGLFLVHRARKNGKKNSNGYDLFDVSIYLVSHKLRGKFGDVDRVEYQLGESRDVAGAVGQRYIVRDPSNGFAIIREGYGPTLCVAKVIFRNGNEVVLNRYLDFEGTGFKIDPKVRDGLVQ
jgi:hypothetical protein